MAPQLKLIYFDGRGRAELTRLILAQAGAKYEDYRFKMEEWASIKPQMPFGQVPVLEVIENGAKTHVSQSIAMARYVASLHGMYGDNALERARIDMVVDACSDIGNKAVAMYHAKDEETKESLKKKFVEEEAPFFLKCINKVLNGNKFLVGQKLSMADIMAAYTIDGLDTSEIMKVDVAKIEPKMAEFAKSVLGLPKIKEWIEKRPKTAF